MEMPPGLTQSWRREEHHDGRSRVRIILRGSEFDDPALQFGKRAGGNTRSGFGCGRTSVGPRGRRDGLGEKGRRDSQEGWITDVSAARRPTADTREYLVVRIVKGIPPHFYPRATGYALPFAGQGVHVTLFYDRIEKVSVGSIVGPAPARFLGTAMAHEIGHVLLGSTEHSAQGIMKGNWGPSESRLIACRGLHFTPENAAALRAGAAGRLATGQIQKAPPPTLVLPVTASESYRRSLRSLRIDASR